MVGRFVFLVGLLLAAPAFPAAPDIFLEAEVEPAEVHVQTQAVYRLRFYQGVDVADLKITGPSALLADLRPVGEGRVYEARRDGRRYRVHEKSYAVFPFASGSLEFTGAGASGRLPRGDSADGRQTVQFPAPARTLKVWPIPAGAGTPARALWLEETWEGTENPRQGVALRRTVVIQAAGIDAGLLPELVWEAPGLTVHPEPARLSNRFQGETNLATREQTFRVVPLESGPLAVPAVRLPWWKVAERAPALASLPALTLEVSGSGDSLVAEPSAPSEPRREIPWAMAAGIGGLVLAVLLAGAWIGRRRDWRRLERACRSGRIDAVRDGLLAWAAGRWPDAPPATLLALSEMLDDPQARRAAAELDRQFYGPAGNPEEKTPVLALVRRIMRGAGPARGLGSLLPGRRGGRERGGADPFA